MSCTDKNSLQREGTSNLTRVLAALSTSYAQVDERDRADLILFAKRYASLLNYYETSETPGVDGTWEPLMKMDISVTLATLSKIQTAALADYKKLLYKRLRGSNDPNAMLQFKFLFDLIFSLLSSIDEQYKLLPDDQEIKLHISNSIIKTRQAVVNINKLFGDFVTNGWLDLSETRLDSDAPIPVSSASDFQLPQLSPDWSNATVVNGMTIPSLLTIKENIVHIINHNFFNSQVEAIFKGATEIVSQAGISFDATLENFSSHNPHYALFLAFTSLFHHAQEELNRFTQRLIDFYYKDVLQLQNKHAEADVVHVLFELQKPVLQHRIEKETLFRGGKDSIGREISYSLTEDIVLNKATVASMHAQQLLTPTGKLLAFPVPASDDGEGAPLTSVDQSWFSFGDPKKKKKADVGFALASNIFFLKEGSRNITVTVNFRKAFSKSAIVASKTLSGFATAAGKLPVRNCFRARLTGEKGWLEVANVILLVDERSSRFIFNLKLSPSDPAIVPYTEKIHKENFYAGLPVCEFILNQDAPDAFSYLALCKKKISSIDMAVEVNGVKDLVLSNDTGSVDASKPFKPFGDFPGINASFYIGSREIFQKQLTGVDLNFDWKNGAPSLQTAKYLSESNWTGSFPIVSDTIRFLTPGTFISSPVDFSKAEPLKATSLDGFLQIQLNDDSFSLEKHLKKISDNLSAMTMTDNSGVFSFSIQPTPVPGEIILDGFSLDYRAKTSILFTEQTLPLNHLLFHLASFGYRQVHPLLDDHELNAEKIQSETLLPDLLNEGELFIGFKDAAANLVINVLFQVSDGSSNPLKNMEELHWYYLSKNNNWKKFEKQFIIDRTRNLTQSGIVTMTLPADISNDESLMEKGLHWIKIGVTHNSDAVCKLIMVQAQAGQIQLVQDDIKQIEFRNTLLSGSVSRLVVSDASIKSVAQPFDSFGGRTRETDEHFYLRVSERLRHKQRANSIWDYEHIILEKFPEIFKVKCLNHSGFYFEGDEEIFCENYPGHVTIVPLPDLKNKTNRNLLKPYTPIRLLESMNDYVRKLNSPFVKLHVKNPSFEEIQLEFEVKFYDNLDEAFYLQLLNTEIEKFLCPWAYDQQREISFGGKIRKSAILNFVEERSYVDFVINFQMNQVIGRDAGQTKKIENIEVAEGSTSRSILVSFYDEITGTRHLIKSPAIC